MSTLDKAVRLPIYDTQTGMTTGELVEIPVVLLQNYIQPIGVFNLKLRIIPKE